MHDSSSVENQGGTEARDLSARTGRVCPRSRKTARASEVSWATPVMSNGGQVGVGATRSELGAGEADLDVEPRAPAVEDEARGFEPGRAATLGVPG